MKKMYLLGSMLLAALVAVSAIGGIFWPAVYSKETVNFAAQGIAQDWVNLVIATPLLVISGFLAYKKSQRAYLVWLGILIYAIYSFIVYAFTVHFGIMFPVYLAILGLSFYLFLLSLFSYDLDSLKKDFHESWSRKAVASTLLVTSVLFYLLWGKDIFSNLFAGTVPKSIVETGLPTNPIYVLDTAFYLPGLIITGIMLLRQKKFGYVFAAPFLVSSMLLAAMIIAIYVTVAKMGFAVEWSLPIGFSVILLVYGFFLVSYLKNLRA